MTEKLKQIIKEETAKLPKEIQEVIGMLDWTNIAEEIGKKYLLNESEINNFQAETLLTLVGITDSEFYAINIENHVGTIKETAEKIAEEAKEKIFTPMYNMLVENIKKSEKSKNPNWQQTLNFILSGGDYYAFIEETVDKNPNTQKTNKLIGTSNILEVKDRLIN